MPVKHARLFAVIALLFVFGLGLGARLYDLTDQPIDFHPTRQLRGAIIARGMYYQMYPEADPETRALALSFWDSTGKYEPSLLERMVATVYLLIGREYVWVSRIFTILFWMVGGLVLFKLGLRMSSVFSCRSKYFLTEVGRLCERAGGVCLLPPAAVWCTSQPLFPTRPRYGDVDHLEHICALPLE